MTTSAIETSPSEYSCEMHREHVPGGLLGATITPLASIFGSGVLVIAAILTAAVSPSY